MTHSNEGKKGLDTFRNTADRVVVVGTIFLLERNPALQQSLQIVSVIGPQTSIPNTTLTTNCVTPDHIETALTFVHLCSEWFGWGR